MKAYEHVTGKKTPFHFLFWVKGQIPFMKKEIAGVTLWPFFILLEEKYKESHPELLAHELTHVAQIQQNALQPLFYIYQSFKYGYKGNKYEKEAYAVQRKVRAFLRKY